MLRHDAIFLKPASKCADVFIPNSGEFIKDLSVIVLAGFP